MIQLLHGDCLKLMFDLPDNSVDMVCCDMPYGTTQNSWDSVLPLDMLWYHYKRVCKENSAIILTAAQPFTSILINSNLKWFKHEWIWEKDAGTGFLNAKKYPLLNHENILVFAPKVPKYNPQMRTGLKPYYCKQGHVGTNYGSVNPQNISISNGERYPLTVLSFNRDSNSKHPTQKPVALIEYLIKTYTNEGDTVLDNCMGSGTAGEACIRTDRKFIGIELDDKYFQIAKERIENSRGLFDLDKEIMTA